MGLSLIEAWGHCEGLPGWTRIRGLHLPHLLLDFSVPLPSPFSHFLHLDDTWSWALCLGIDFVLSQKKASRKVPTYIFANWCLHSGFLLARISFLDKYPGRAPFGAQCLLLAFGQCGFGQKAQQDPGQDPGSGLISADWLVARSTVGLVCFATLRRRQSPRSRHTQTHLVSL